MGLADFDIRAALAPVLRQALERDVTIAVTGLSGAGKTVFTTALVHNLSLAHRRGAELLPFLAPARDGRISAVTLDESRPRPFPYAPSLRALTGSPSAWPPSTTGVSELAIRIDYRLANPILRHAAPSSRLTLHIVDYPGEWLLDLPLLEQSYGEWSADSLALCRVAPRAAHAQEFLSAVDETAAQTA